ncbi:unnamed protein product [Clavelina lepadiformis]|uniref:Rab-GAP TBC domain-containing protein n=1 Tax=Clavelina lepadiformis TaxID=159417 RepID=A0ABP0FAY1_CLALP
MFRVKRSSDVKDVIHIKVKKYAGYFNPESRSFAVDPHLTTFEDLQKILIEAFNLNGPFHLTYLCRDDAGENIFLSMLTEWDLDAAFLTSSDPHLRLKLDAEPYKDGLMSKTDWDLHDSPSGTFGNQSNVFRNFLYPVTNSMNSMLSMPNMQRNWIDSLGGAFGKLAGTLVNNSNNPDDCSFFPSKPPLDDAEFRNYLDETGKLTKPEELRLRVYHGGVAPALRKVVWRMLLNIFPNQLNGKERIAYMKKKADEYGDLRSKWQAKADHHEVRQISNMVWKDVLRTDRSHPFFDGPDDNPNTIALMNILTTFALTHPKVSYCQGMSDLVSPILMVMNNEAQAYICFCAIMIRLRNNFSTDGNTMSIKFKHLALLLKNHDLEFFNYLKSLGADNMFFCYRWILLEMKREFSFDDAVTVLEVMWSSLPPQPPVVELPLLDDDVDSSIDKTFPSNSCSEKVNNTASSAKLQNDFSSNTKKCAKTKTPTLLEISSSSSSTSFNSYDTLPDSAPLLTPYVAGEDLPSIASLTNSTDTISTHDGSGKLVQVSKEDIQSVDAVKFFDPSAPLVNGETKELSNKLPPPEELGCGNPFLMFVCLAVLLDERDTLLAARKEYDDMVMHFDRMVRKHQPRKVLSKAMTLFAEYLRTDVS